MTNDLNAVRMLLGPAIMYSANTVLFSVGALFFLLRISPFLTLVALVPLPLASILVQAMGRRIHERFERIQAMYSEISAQAQENFSAARLVRAFVQEEAQIDSFEKANQENIRRGLRLVQLMGMLWPTLEFVLGLAGAITLLAGGHEVLTHRISVGDFVAFNVYMVMLTWPIIALGWVVNLVQRGSASVIRIDELLAEKPAIDNAAADPAIAQDLRLRGEIEFRDLSFAYTDSTGQRAEVLHSLSLKIPAGSSLAVVGPTGSGKSTLVNLIPRLYDAAPGSVLIDGRPIRDYPLATLRANIGFVPQETFLFSETIRGNVAFGTQQATDSQVLEAAEAAHIRREFEEFPAGLRNPRGGTGNHALGRPKAAHRDRPRPAARSASAYPRRRALERRHLYRGTDPRRTAKADGRPHHDLYFPSHFHCSACRPDCRAGRRPHRRARNTRSVDREKRLLCRPVAAPAS